MAEVIKRNSIELIHKEFDENRNVWRVSGTVDNLEKMLQALGRRLGVLGWNGEDFDALTMSFDEAGANARKHGNKNDPNKIITVRLNLGRSKSTISIQDQGTGFDPARVSEPATAVGVLREEGRGVAMMRQLCDKVVIKGNLVTLIKKRRGLSKRLG